MRSFLFWVVTIWTVLNRFHSILSAGEIQSKKSENVSIDRARALRHQILFRKPIYKYNEPADLIDLVPGLREIKAMIPRQFSLADHEFVLDPQRITIHHEWMDVRSRRTEKTSIISLSYSGSSPGFYAGSRLDVPLFYSSHFGFSDWSRYPLGNYTFTFDRDSPFNREQKVYIRALTRF